MAVNTFTPYNTASQHNGQWLFDHASHQWRIFDGTTWCYLTKGSVPGVLPSNEEFLRAKYPALQDLYLEFKKAEEKYKMYKILLEGPPNVNS